ncbi:HipA N-terminal domain-containing protein [Fulvivirga lutea]|uniref:HipA N-terminal domain-containing protein n=1 Tax=Fulvivirga lutea TaxID=2810512 RepID=A0A974WI36_9BACT|nr:HipA N-terminal domain-containing protein [Fulvivirga lutea]QSE98168.1 HipA N-terminal domain-containing protein [Fulvivirga lutea]
MNKRAEVYNNNLLAGLLEKTEQGEYTFTYDQHYLNNPETSAISLTMPKTEQTYQSSVLFPFFYGLLSEGVNRQTQCRLLKIDEKDHFSLLLKTAKTDTIGSITINEITK